MKVRAGWLGGVLVAGKEKRAGCEVLMLEHRSHSSGKWAWEEVILLKVGPPLRHRQEEGRGGDEKACGVYLI